MDLSKIGKFIQEQRKAKNKNNQKIEPTSGPTLLYYGRT